MPRIPTIADTLNQIVSAMIAPTNNANYAQKGYRISYLPFADDTQSDETAICFSDNTHTFGERMLILNGNHVSALKGKTLDEAKEYWEANPSQWGYSTDMLEG